MNVIASDPIHQDTYLIFPHTKIQKGHFPYQEPTTMATKTASFKAGSEVFKTSYTVFGDLKSGISHWYMLPHAAELYRKCGPPVALCDQLDSGDSTRLRDKPADFFTPGLFVSELDNLLRHLGITHDFDLLGQSWSVTLAVEYVAAHHPAGLKHLALASGSASYPLWREALAGRRA
jgi:pimeloyl-ACP methyl ester carboxylesterase